MVEAQHSSKALAAPDRPGKGTGDGGTLQQAIAHSLMIALVVVMRHEMGDRVLKRGLSEEGHSVQTLGLY